MAGLKGFGSFRHFIFGHKTQLIFIYLFFAGFLATGLAYAAITGQHEHFGTANYKPGAQLMIVNATVPGAEPGDLAEIGDHGKTLSFHLNFDEVNAPKVVTFCLHNGAKIDYQLGFPAVVNPDDPSVVVE
ncbi:hypothetical protein FWG76_02835, partial [Candidatus Saccharibacteria bacterium]|nr:hypothetical protein [Candidatus Saccharibacteria bacterium]